MKCSISSAAQMYLNRNEVFYLISSSDVAYLDCVGIYKAFNFAAFPKIECQNVLSPF